MAAWGNTGRIDSKVALGVAKKKGPRERTVPTFRHAIPKRKDKKNGGGRKERKEGLECGRQSRRMTGKLNRGRMDKGKPWRRKVSHV